MDRAILHLSGLQQRAGEVEGGWRETRCLAALENRNKHDNIFFKEIETIAKYTLRFIIYHKQKEDNSIEFCREVRGPKAKEGNAAVKHRKCPGKRTVCTAALVPPRGRSKSWCGTTGCPHPTQEWNLHEPSLHFRK